MIDYQLVLDFLITILLGITIGYAVILNRRLSGFRKQKAEMESFVQSLDEAVERAEASIHRLRALAEQTGGDLQERVDKAGALYDELNFMTDRGNAIADRLEKAASGAGRVMKQQQAAQAPAQPAAPPQQPARQERQIGIETRAEEEAAARLAASRIVEAAESAAAQQSPAPRPERAAPVERPAMGEDDARSEAERELLKALRSVR